MFEAKLESHTSPGTRYTIRPLTGPKMLNLTSGQMPYGDAVYDAFGFCCTDWVDAPLLGGDKSPKYDPAMIESLAPGFVQEVVLAAMNQWKLKEEERKNSSSQSTSSTTEDSTAPAANASMG